MSVYIRKRERQKSSRNPYGYVYEIIIDRVDGAGKRVKKSKTLPVGTKKTEAEKIAQRIELEIEYGEYVDREPITFREYFEEKYLKEYVVSANLSPTTIRNYKQMYYVENGINDYMGDDYINSINTEKLQNYVRLQTTKYNRSPKTVKNHIGLIRNIVHRAMIDQYVTKRENPASYVVMPVWEKKPIEAYTLSQVRVMLRRAEETNNLLMLGVIGCCCLGGGLRRSELCGLTNSRCYVEKKYENKAIEICESVVQVDGGQETRHCKSKHSIRTVLIGDTLCEIILKIKKKNLEKKLHAGEDFQGGDYLFISDTYPYPPIKPNTLYNYFKRFLRTECPDLPCLRLHDLRSTYASIGAQLNFNQYNLKSALGHSDISVTQNFYIKSQYDSMKQDIDVLEMAFKQSS